MLTDKLRKLTPYLLAGALSLSGVGCKKEGYEVRTVGEVRSTEQDKLLVDRKESLKIAFTSERDGNQEVYVMNADGSEQRNLTNNPARDYYPTLSPYKK